MFANHGGGTTGEEQESMSDLERYVRKRKRLDPEFAEGLEVGYSNFKVGVLLRQGGDKARFEIREKGILVPKAIRSRSGGSLLELSDRILLM